MCNSAWKEIKYLIFCDVKDNGQGLRIQGKRAIQSDYKM